MTRPIHINCMHVQIHLIQLRSSMKKCSNAIREVIFFLYISVLNFVSLFDPHYIGQGVQFEQFENVSYIWVLTQNLSNHSISFHTRILAYVFLYWTLNPSVLQVFVQESSFKHQIYFSCQGLLKSRFRKPIHSSHTLHLKNI